MAKVRSFRKVLIHIGHREGNLTDLSLSLWEFLSDMSFFRLNHQSFVCRLESVVRVSINLGEAVSNANAEGFEVLGDVWCI
jgi:hypothetical protein